MIYPGTHSWLAISTLKMYGYFIGVEPVPDDFFADIGEDGEMDGLKEKIKRLMPHLPSVTEDFYEE